MNAFWLVAGVLAVLASTPVLWALRRSTRSDMLRDPRREENLAGYRQRMAELELQREAGTIADTDYRLAKVELDRRLLDDTDPAVPGAAAGAATGGTLAVWLGALAIPVLALALYQGLGASQAIRLDAMLKQLAGNPSEEQRMQLQESMLPLLESVAGGDDPDGEYRYLLARSYLATRRYPEAAAVYAELVDIYPEDAAIIAQSAQALYLASSRKLTPAVQALIDRAFAIDPEQLTLLGMVGMDRFQAGDYSGAIEHWQKLLDHLPADAPDARVIRDGIAMARGRLGLSAEDAPAVAETPESVAGGSRLQVSVSVANGLQLNPGDTVFVFARAVEGPPMPLAVARFAASELPRQVELNDSMAMAPGLKLSGFERVSVTARVSRGGAVAAQPGDLEGGGEAIELDGTEQAVAIVIDRTI